MVIRISAKLPLPSPNDVVMQTPKTLRKYLHPDCVEIKIKKFYVHRLRVGITVYNVAFRKFCRISDASGHDAKTS